MYLFLCLRLVHKESSLNVNLIEKGSTGIKMWGFLLDHKLTLLQNCVIPWKIKVHNSLKLLVPVLNRRFENSIPTTGI